MLEGTPAVAASMLLGVDNDATLEEGDLPTFHPVLTTRGR